MAKIDRFNGNLKAFGINAVGGERTVFGDVAQSDTLDANINTDFLRGWGIVGVNENPVKQDFNAMGFVLGQLLAYLHQMGVAEWNATQEYHIGSTTQVGEILYISHTNTNVGNNPSTDDGTNWRPVLSADQGTVTLTLTGCTTTPTIAVRYVKVGKVVTLSFNADNISGTSNTTAKTLTGLPSSLAPQVSYYDSSVSVDNGGLPVASLARFANTGAIVLQTNPAGTPWTASGTMIWYPQSYTYIAAA